MGFLQELGIKPSHIIGTITAFFALLLLSSAHFTVKENEYVIIRQFGEIMRIEQDPGLKFKWPLIQSAEAMPRLLMINDVPQAEINTKDKKRMIVDNYAIWSIVNPKEMIQNARTVENAEAKMSEFIFSIVRAELGQLNYDEIINDEESKRGDISRSITKQVNALLAQDHYGILVKDVRIKRTDLPKENEHSVYTRMISERNSKAQEYTSMGTADYDRITANTDKEVAEMIAISTAKGEAIRAEGETEAAKIYNMSYAQDAEFYAFYRTLLSYKKTINGETVIMLPSSSPYAKSLLSP